MRSDKNNLKRENSINILRGLQSESPEEEVGTRVVYDFRIASRIRDVHFPRHDEFSSW